MIEDKLCDEIGANLYFAASERLVSVGTARNRSER